MTKTLHAHLRAYLADAGANDHEAELAVGSVAAIYAGRAVPGIPDDVAGHLRTVVARYVDALLMRHVWRGPADATDRDERSALVSLRELDLSGHHMMSHRQLSTDARAVLAAESGAVPCS